MSQISLPLEIRDQVCKGPLGHYVEQVYSRIASGSRINSAFLQLGQSAVDAEEALKRADRMLAAKWPSRAPLAGAASILRLCERHDTPVIEVVENVIAITPPVEKFNVFGVGDILLEPVETHNGVTSYMSLVDFNDPPRWIINPRRLICLPKESYERVRNHHRGTTSLRAYEMNFGLLGGETLFDASSLSEVPATN